MTDELDLGVLRTPEGFYLVNQIQPAPFEAEPDADADYRHRFTYRGSDTSIKRAAIELIESATRKIFLASFRIGDRELLDALLAAVNRLKGGVYVITSWTETSLKRDLASIEDVDEIDIQAQKKRFDELTRRGIALRGHEECHAKFLLVDDRYALVSSANLETSALTDTPRRQATGESGVVVADPTEVNRLARLFTSLWYAGCKWQASIGAEYALHERASAASPTNAEPRAAGPGIIWTDTDGAGGERGILRALHDVIGGARSELLLATFSLVGIRDRPELLLDPLRRAIAERNVDVRLLVRARNNIAAHRADTAALADLGVAIYGDSKTHAKGVIADGVRGALFSANFDADHGIYNGVEVGVRLDGRPALREAHRYFLHAMAHADLRFTTGPTQRELDRGLGAGWRRRWPLAERVPVVATDADWRSLVRVATAGPVLWEQTDDLRIYLAGLVARLRPDSGGHYRLLMEPAKTDATARLQAWLGDRSRSVDRKSKRGCCPAILARVSRPGPA